MTSRQRRTRAYSTAERRPAQTGGARENRRPAGQQRGNDRKRTSKTYKQCVQLAVSAAVFLTVAAVRLLLPEAAGPLGEQLTQIMDQNIDVEGVFSAVGRTFSQKGGVQQTLDDAYQAVFHPGTGHLDSSTAAGTLADSGDLSEDLLRLRRFASGEGSSTAWLSSRETLPPELTENGGTAGNPSGNQPESPSESPPGEETEPSSVWYLDQNLPDNVHMEQCILDFDYCTPVSGVLSSGFGYREHPVEGEEKFHYGIDLAADTGTPVLCFADGTVTAAGESSSYGKYLTVTHAGGYTTLYAHCSKLLVSAGAEVKGGAAIAEVGETGMATGPHLHFELHQGSVYLNPIYYVQTA